LTLVPGALKLRVGVVSTVGNYREHNEDNFYVPGRRSILDGGSTGLTSEMNATEFEPVNGTVLPVFIVADGMGGQQAGEEASRMAIDIIPKAISRRLPSDETDAKAVQTAIREAVAEANQEILGSSGAVTEYSNMGTTVVLALFRGDKVYFAGIGDSPAYRYHQGKLEQLTKDHSLAMALFEAGTISREELPTHKFKNILYLYLGSKDARGGPEDVPVVNVEPGDRFLLASDGLTGVVRDEEIARVLATCDTPQQAAKVLKDMALANDSKDNVTCLVIHATDGSQGPA
jgi:protein phosphatase